MRGVDGEVKICLQPTCVVGEDGESIPLGRGGNRTVVQKTPVVGEDRG